MWKGNGVNLMVQAPFTALEFYFYEFYKNNLFGAGKNLTFWNKLFCGAMTGMSATVFVYPLDVIRTFLTLNKDKNKHSILRQTRHIISEKGLSGMYSGILTSFFGIMPFIGIRMSTYDVLMSRSRSARESNQAIAISLNLVCGASAGLAATTICYPFDMIRRLLQLNGTAPEHSYKNLWDLLRQIKQQHGLLGFYRGFGATLAKSIPMTGLMFFFNEQMKKTIGI